MSEKVEIPQAVLMAAAISGRPVMVNGVAFKVEMEFEGFLEKPDGTRTKIETRRI